MATLVSVPVLSVKRCVTRPSSSLMSDELHLHVTDSANELPWSQVSSGHKVNYLAGTSRSSSYSLRSQRKNWLAGNFCSSRVTYIEMGMR